MAIQISKLAEMKGNLQQTCTFNTTELCSHSKPFHLDKTAHTDCHCAQFRKAAKLVYFMHHLVYGGKSNLLTWAIRPIFSNPVTYRSSKIESHFMIDFNGCSQDFEGL